ncbi:hypothetical protein PSHT_08771 [Puccinia striiformis]|uniref:Uncharacterized protein n=1 Tax=Puccinia striiformis TaxID=27350 RepID=A0A2S4VLC3_9BASI|nr:hypothetical protein PSHT_08771 [Puccinia striiformis]
MGSTDFEFMWLLEFVNYFFVICGPTTSAIKNSAILPMMRFLHDPGPCFRHPLAYNSGTPICLAQHSASYWSWYHFLVFLGLVFVRLARSWASPPIPSLLDIKGPLSVVVFPSSSHHISSSATPTRSSSLSSVVVPLLLSNMSSFNQTSSAHQHQNPPPYQQYQNHGYSLRPRAPAVRGRGGRAPQSARPAVRTSPARRLGPVLRSVPARRGVIRQPFRGNRNSPVISPAISAVRGRYLDPISSPRIITVNRFVVSSSHRNPFLQHTPTQRFITPPGLRMPVNAPEPEARPFSVARPALESLTNYLRPENADAGPAWVNPPTPRPHNLATPPSPLAPAGFDPSPRADAWAQRTSSASSGSTQSASSAESLTPSSLGSNSGIIMYHRLNDDQIHLLLEDPDSVNPYDVSRFELPSPEHHYAFLATNFINYCHEFPTSNPVIQCARVRFFKRLSCLRGRP